MNSLEMLRSDDPLDIIDALFKIGAGEKTDLDLPLRLRIEELVNHDDSEVREQVVACAGVRLRVKEMFPIFWRRLSGDEKNPAVILTLIDAVTALVHHGEGSRDALTRLLNGYLFSELMPDEIRGSACLAMLRLWEKISPREYATAPRRLSEMTFDLEELRKLMD